MVRRSKHDWLQLFSDFECSGQTQAEFCTQRDINPNYFSLKLSKHKAASPSAFVKVAIESRNQTPKELVLEVGNCKIHFPATMPAESPALAG